MWTGLEILLVLQSLPLLFLQGMNPRGAGTWEHNKMGLALNTFKFVFSYTWYFETLLFANFRVFEVNQSELISCSVVFLCMYNLVRCLERIVLLTASNKQQAAPDNSVSFFHFMTSN